MKKKYFIDSENNYLGVYINGAKPPKGSKEVEPLPDNNHVHNGTGWIYDEATHWENTRNKRDTLLADTDLQAALPDHPQRQALLDYRQALRDLPQTFASPGDVVWPINPLEGDSE